MNSNQRGRRLLLATFAALIAFDVLVALLDFRANGASVLWPSVARVVLSLALMFAIYRGKAWARWLLVSLLSIAFIVVVVATVFLGPNALLLALAVVCATANYVVAFDRKVHAFLVSQRASRL